MHAEPALPAALLYGFLLVLARISGIFIFIPLPTFKNGPSAAKIVLALALTLALFPLWPKVNPVPASILQIAGWVLAEAAIGLAAVHLLRQEKAGDALMAVLPADHAAAVVWSR